MRWRHQFFQNAPERIEDSRAPFQAALFYSNETYNKFYGSTGITHCEKFYTHEGKIYEAVRVGRQGKLRKRNRNSVYKHINDAFKKFINTGEVTSLYETTNYFESDPDYELDNYDDIDFFDIKNNTTVDVYPEDIIEK